MPNHHSEFDNGLFYIELKSLHCVFEDPKSQYHMLDLSDRVGYVKRKYFAYKQYMFQEKK